MPGQSLFDAALPLGDESQVYWRRAAPGGVFAGDLTIQGGGAIDAGVIDGPGPTYVRVIRLRDQDGGVVINLSGHPDYNAPADELTSEAETQLRLCVQYKTGRVAVAITGDTTEPYSFSPANAPDVMAFVAAWKADADNAAEPVHAALVWGGEGSRIDFSGFTTRPPPLHLAATLTATDALTGRAALRQRLRLSATLPPSGALTGTAALRQRLHLAAALAPAGRLTGEARLRVHDPNAYAHALRAASPEAVVLYALEIRHPALSEPVRVVNDGVDHRIEGRRYVALRFAARPADDTQGKAPQAELMIDNIGRELMAWVEAADGGVGATVRMLRVVAGDSHEPEWEMTFDVARVRADQRHLVVSLGFDPLLDRSAVLLRHDPETSPGLF